jgi:hypothetical protein
MAKKAEKITLHHDFVASSDAELGALIVAFRGEHEATHGESLAMDGKRSLGPGKVRVTFRVVAKKGRR